MKVAADGTIPEHHPNCLGCGSQNPAGMGLRLRVDGDLLRGTITFDRRHEGAPGIVHGGAVATVLDDSLGSLLIVLGTPAVTANLNVSFRAPALLERPMQIEAWAVGRDGRKLHLHGRLLDNETVIAEAQALFLIVDVTHFESGGHALLPGWEDWSPASDPSPDA
ncbi:MULTISPECIES: PaaI family thioesterase [Patulibacter]|jgi:acyl-coenzyme A thioesterase PaaI-like protein|uniref:Acyl-coenzyme A thioesterase THEM4 n=1 Tax=freshwater metagenome TaxID=449393 RepID=A0A6J7H8N6_9ZZZZ|nr:PaaI family thioesterase [Patulibacter minatonensis]